MENKVGFQRRNLLVPVPRVTDLLVTNHDLLGQSEHLWQRRHYKKSRTVTDLFTDERAEFRALPPQAFAPYRYTRVRTDRQGRFGLEHQHRYSSAPEYAQHALIVRVGAHTVEPLAADGRPLTVHARVYGAGRTDSTDYRTTVHRLAQKPGAWRNSPLRQGVPTPVRAALDAAARADLQAALQGLAHCTDQWGFDHAVRALEEAVALKRTAYADIVTIGRRMALAPAQLTAGRVDLRQFDVLLEGREAE